LRESYLRHLKDIYDDSKERLSKTERQEWINHRLSQQISYAYRRAPAVAKKMKDAGVTPKAINTVKDLESLPVTSKDELARLQQAAPPFGGFLAVPLNSLSRIYVSPGPIYDAWGVERVRAGVRGYLRQGWPKSGDVVLVANAYHMVPAGLFVTDCLDALGCTVVPSGTGQTELQVKLLRDLQVTTMISFPSFTMTVLNKAEEMGYDIRRDLRLKYITGGGERHIQVLRKVFEDKYGLVVSDGYGTGDLGVVAYDCGCHQGYHYDDLECVIEIVDPVTGRQLGPYEQGEIVVTLFSKVYPLVRFGTGDLASFTEDVCACGRTAPRITGITGMIGEHIRVKGMFVHLRELRGAMEKFREVAGYQLVVELDGHKDKLTLTVEANANTDQSLLTEALSRSCQEAFKLRMDKIELLPPGSLPANHGHFVDLRWGKEQT
jgi:phenylacetate-CoA ligase